MAYDPAHRTIVRSEIQSALRRYLVSEDAHAGTTGDEGEREAPPRSFSTNGGTMAIGCGCFLIRPGKPSERFDGESFPPASARGNAENTAESTPRFPLSEVVFPSESTTEEDGKPTGNAAGTADNGAGPPTRSSSSLSDKPATPGAVRDEDNNSQVGAEANTPNSLTANDEDVTKSQDNTSLLHEVKAPEHYKNKDGTIEDKKKITGATAEVGVEAGAKPSTPTDSVDGATAHGDDENSEVGLPGVDGELQMQDAASDTTCTVGSNDENNTELSENSVLNALLSDMTSAADAWVSATRLTGTENRERAPKAETPGCTAIVFLDAPLITRDLHPRTIFLRKTNRSLFGGPPRESLDQANPVPRESAEAKATATLSDDGTASSRGSKGSDIDSPAPGEPANLNEPTDDVDEQPGGDAVGASEQHPAGLGDPSEALERLIDWMGQGDSSGCGGREVVLVCKGGNPPVSGEGRRGGRFDDDSSDMSTSARKDRVRLHGHSNNVMRQSLDAIRAENSDRGNVKSRNIEAIVRANDVDVILQGEGGAEKTAVDGTKGHSSNADEKQRDERTPGTIRQIVLGGTVPIEVVPQQQGQLPASETRSDPLQVDGYKRTTKTMKAPSVVVGMRNKSNNSSNNDPDQKSPTQPGSSIVHPPPSQVLLQTKPAAPTGQSLSRVALTFPPPTVPPAALRPTSETDKCLSKVPLDMPSAEDSDSAIFDDSVRVVVGPVIGRVSPTSGIVLVEVDSVAEGATPREDVAEGHASDGVGVRLTDTLTGQTRQMTGGTWTGGQPGKGPRVFEFEGLAPGRRYALRLSGVRQRDQVSSGSA